MRNPAIQNDFSYYRRTISRNRINNMHVSPWVALNLAPFSMALLISASGRAQREDNVLVCNSVPEKSIWSVWLSVYKSIFSSYFHQLDIENEVNNEMANRMSLFYAEATPMLKTLSNATMHFVSEVSEVEQRGAFFLNSRAASRANVHLCLLFRTKPCQ